MTATTSTAQALRIALIHAGRIIEDRTLEPGKKATISVGADPKSTFCVPMGELPKAVTLFKVTKDAALLVKGGAAEGRVSLGGVEQALADVPGSELSLPRGSRGRVKVGDVTVLFQLVTPSAPPPQLELPKGARGLTAQLDRAFVVAMALSLTAHLVGAGYVWAQPTPVEQELSLEELQLDRHAAVLLPMPKKLVEPAVPQAPEKPAEVVKPPKPAVADAAPAKPKGAITGDAMKSKLARMGMLKVIGAVGGEDGLAADLLKDSSHVGSVGDAMKGASDVRVATAGDLLASDRKGADEGTTVGVGAIGTNGVKDVRLSDKGDVAVTGSVKEAGPISIDTPDISPDALASWMRQRRSAIQSCYERELKRDRSLSGRLVVKFVITPRGRVSELDLSEGSLHNRNVSDCITSIARNWVLPFTPEDDVPVAFPFVFSPVN
ncbi:MAG: AgmX/PglI C-terminal domain-containing protein [Myxococcaceae bacterium]|nr:AgmX/PglI C-terminal domain-containing protein [Myxococcaceae bacterium]